MDYGQFFRRIFHLCGPGVLVFYLFPDHILGMQRVIIVLTVLALLLIMEIVRLHKGQIFFGMREYERDQLSAYAWAGIGVAIAFIFFPMPLVVCAVVGLSWADPLIGEMRKRKKMNYYPAVPLAIYFCIVVFCLLIFTKFQLIPILILAFVGSMAAIAVEKPKIPVDDDFLMLVVPLVVLTLVYEYLDIAGLII